MNIQHLDIILGHSTMIDESYRESYTTYAEIKEYLKEEDSVYKLKEFLPLEKVFEILDNLLEFFLDYEDYEICNEIQEWKIKLSFE